MIFWIAAIAGASYSLAGWMGLHGPPVVAWKGSGVALLALWASRSLAGSDARQFTGVLGLAAIGDVLLDAVGLVAGGAAFFAAHALAIAFYHRHRARPAPLAGVVAGATAGAALAWLFAHDAGAAIYSLAVCAMAIMASHSRFPPRVMLGAGLFVLSDLLIFARMGPLADHVLPWLLIWPLYFAGQVLIAHGVVTSLRDVRRGGAPSGEHG